MAKKIKKAPVEFPVLNVRLEGKSRSFAIVKHAVQVPKFNKTFTAEQLQQKENAAVVAHLISKGASILKEIHGKADDGNVADEATRKTARMVAEKAAENAAEEAAKGAATKAAQKAAKEAEKAADNAAKGAQMAADKAAKEAAKKAAAARKRGGE